MNLNHAYGPSISAELGEHVLPGALGDMLRQGKVQVVGLSEVSAATLRKSRAEYRTAAVQTEYPL